jgi:DNA-binding transcriptional MerR regulator/methylmalonyl-CoA mutase cobalamin-binding subunit
MEPQHPIKIVAKRTGLTAHVIRVWEKRYKVVTPARTSTERRLYTESDIERLGWLAKATEAGHSIGSIAHLPTEQIMALVKADEAAMPPLAVKGIEAQEHPWQSLLTTCLEAVERFDGGGLEAALARGLVSLSQPVLLEQVVLPLVQKIGDLWRGGVLRVAHEHMASAVVRSFVGGLWGSYDAPEAAPCLIATTPAGQLHEIGVLIAATTAASDGWKVLYLGPNLPAEEIAAAADQNRAKVVALSLVYPADDPRLVDELRKLRRYLSDGVRLIVGGRAAGSYAEILDSLGAVRLDTMQGFRTRLELIRSSTVKSEE